jgi:gem associated protein 2
MDDAVPPEGAANRRRVYSRAEIEALKGFPSAEAQAQLWAEVYAALAVAGFAGEYDGLLAGEEARNRRWNKGKKAASGRDGRKGLEQVAALGTALPSRPFCSRPLVKILFRSNNTAPGFRYVFFPADVVDNGAWRNGDLGLRDEHRLEAVHESAGVYGEVHEPLDEGEDVECEDDSGDEYEGILKPAFAVDGEPDFESGEPLDGFEYIRRVRYYLLALPTQI